ncbi:hypothetical protein G6F56_001448 [Rhizopus delemar]|nr:hypothetical protein G6F56_001448 [Rhizopus delemar]
MVATQPYTSTAAPGSSNQARQRPSYHRTSEKYSISPSKPARIQQKRRSRSVCTVPVQHVDNRRPSAPVMSSVPRLSIANRFMTPSSSDPEPDNSDMSSELSTKRLSVAECFMKEPSSSSLNIQDKRSISSSSLQEANSSPFSDSGRLTIAETFMKSSATLPLNKKPSLASFESPSISSDYVSKSIELFTENPLEEDTRQDPFDDLHGFNMDSYFKPSLDSTLESIKRPWGSQDTLVHPENKKKPIYAQFVDEYCDNQSLSSRDYTDMPEYSQSTDDLYANHDNDHYDLESAHEKPEQEKKKRESDLKKVKKQPKKQPSTQQQKQQQEEPQTNGLWMGCCLISCGGQERTRRQDKRKSGCGRRLWVIFVFLFLIAAAVIIGYIWPRTPLMRIDGASLTTTPKISETKQSAMVGNVAFESDWLVNITVDNRQNHVPTRLTQVQVVTKDALTGLMIGKGLYNDENPLVLPPNAITKIQIPIHVDYQARDSTDTTFMDLIRACSPKYSLNDPSLPTGQHEALPLHFWITLHFLGLDWLKYNPTVIATPATGGFVCPQ